MSLFASFAFLDRLSLKLARTGSHTPTNERHNNNNNKWSPEHPHAGPLCRPSGVPGAGQTQQGRRPASNYARSKQMPQVGLKHPSVSV